MSRWVVVGLSEVLAAHAAMLPTGHILYFSGSEYNPDQHNTTQIDHTRLYDCVSGTVIRVPSPTTDLFCCGQALLADGPPHRRRRNGEVSCRGWAIITTTGQEAGMRGSSTMQSADGSP